MDANTVHRGTPPRARTLGALLDEVAAARGDGEALVFRGARHAYADLKRRADDVARALLATGVRRGDRVAILLGNRPEWLVTAFAAAKVGAIVVGISTFATAREIAWTVDHARPAVVVTTERFRGRNYLEALGGLEIPELRAVVAAERFEDFVGRGAGVSDADVAAATRAVTGDDACYILYTSGSTALPKGVVLNHGGVVANGFAIGERQHLSPADRLWLAVPLFWSFGSANALPAILTHGGTVVLQESFDAGEAIGLLDDERCTVYYGMANMARAIREHPDRGRRRLATMRTGLTIGLPEDVAMTMEAVGADQLCNVYGSTETYGNCAVTDAHDPREIRLTTQGLPLPGMDIRVVDPESGRVLPRGEVGELRVKGHVTPGYYRDPEQTAAAFDGDGYFRSGDLGLVDADGRVRFRGRFKEMIKTGGINVAPLEVEAVLLAHPAVKQAYVVGVPDRVKDEAVVAAVELHQGAMATAETLVAHCRESLATYKVPARIVFRKDAELPRTSTGKIHKPRLKDELARQAGPDAVRGNA